MGSGRSLKTDYTEEATINITNVNPKLVNKLNNYCINLDIERKDFLLELIEDRLKGLVLDNTELELDSRYYFNMKELKENGVVTAVKKNPVHEREEIFYIETIPNNLDTFNNEHETYCSDGIPSFHRGINVITTLKANNEKRDSIKDILLKDTIYIYSYDSKEGTLEIAVVNDMDLYFKSEQKQEKEKFKKAIKKTHALFYASVSYDDNNNTISVSDSEMLSRFLDTRKEYFTSFKKQKTFKDDLYDFYIKGEAGNIPVKNIEDVLSKFKDF